MHPPSVVVPLLTPHPRGNRIDRKAQNNQDGNEKNVNNAPHATARITHRELAKSSQQCKSSYLYCYEKTSLEPFYYPSTTTPRNQQARAQTALPPASEGKEPPEKCHYNHPTSTPDDHDRSAASAEEGLAAACEAVEMRWAAGRPRLRKAHVARLKQEFKEGLPVKEAYQVLFDSMENLSSEYPFEDFVKDMQDFRKRKLGETAGDQDSLNDENNLLSGAMTAEEAMQFLDEMG